jgi:hypothetical protein
VTGIAATSLIVFVPVRSGAADQLPAALASLDGDHPSPFSRIPGTHFARLVFVPALTGPDDLPLPEDGSFLMLCADFDTDLAAWAGALCAHGGPQLATIFDWCEGFPGLDDARALEKYLARNRVAAGFTVTGYRRATVAEVREALRLHRELRALAARAQAEQLGASALRAAWREVVMP